METPNNATRPSFQLRQLLLLLMALIVSRLLFIALMPATYSTDLYSWLKVMDVLKSGGNPYRETNVLNWPPFWMQILFGLRHVANASGLSPTHLIQATLIGCEAIVLCVTYAIAQRHFPSRRVFVALLFGLALNPASIFLSCAHCNYDVFVGLFVLLGTWMLLEWNGHGAPEAWLAACFFIGMGILAKTVPVILSPLLLLNVRKLPWPTRIFGAALLAFPIVIGMSVLFTLEPVGVMNNVIGYRSLAGWYGITGLLRLADLFRAMDAYQAASPLLFVGLMIFMAFWCLKQSNIAPGRLLLLPVLLMMFIPTFGPGYSPPYLLWYLPLLTLLFVTSGSGIQRLLIIGCGVIALTYVTEYALFDSHGAYLLQWVPSSTEMADFSKHVSKEGPQALIRIPMFGCYVMLFWMLLRELQSKRGKRSVGER